MKDFICPECGADPFKTVDYDKIVKENKEISDRFKRVMAQHGMERAEWTLQEIRLTKSMAYMQRKVLKQANALRKLEEKLKRQGRQPYKVEVVELEERMIGPVMMRGPKELLDQMEYIHLDSPPERTGINHLDNPPEITGM